jgi:stalled ribosome rescue protein Dom34
MSALIMWINNHEARIFKFNPEGVSMRRLQYKGKHHQVGDPEKFFHEVIKVMNNDKDYQWLIVGPGLAHTHLKHILDKQFPELAKCVVGVEPMAEASDGQIKNYAHEFFKHRGIFEAI